MTDAAATAEPEKSLGGVTDPAVGQTPGRPAPEEHDLATVRPRSDGGDRWLPGPSELPPVGVSGGGTEAESVSAGSLARQLKPPSMATDGSGAINGQGMDGTGREGGPAGASVGTPGSLRRAPNRLQIAQQRGANPETERAVAAALQWIADNQEADGRWSAKRHEGGREIVEAGRDRNAAGSHADTGITGLALLALAASGNTHLEGNHREAVQKGLSFCSRPRDRAVAWRARAKLTRPCTATAWPHWRSVTSWRRPTTRNCANPSDARFDIRCRVRILPEADGGIEDRNRETPANSAGS